MNVAKVKPLVWHNFDAWTHWAEAVCGTYHVEERNGYWQVELRVGGLVHHVTTTDDTLPEDLDAAKAVAQQDYDPRILCELAPAQPAPMTDEQQRRFVAEAPQRRAERIERWSNDEQIKSILRKPAQPAPDAPALDADAVAALVEAETERCAKIADDHTPAKHTAALASHVTGRTIAAAIRAKGGDA